MAAFMLISWPAITLVLFAALGPVRGLIWATLSGYLILPPEYGFQLPGIPDYDKSSAISLALVLGAVLFGRRLPKRQATDTRPLLKWLLIACVVAIAVGAVFTFLDNRVGFSVEQRRWVDVYPGLGLKDLVSMLHLPLIAFVPFILALRWLDTPELHREVVQAVALAGVAYGVLVLFEWRMSPQLHTWVYGYSAHGWRQHRRYGGFRAGVFLDHGLSVGFFLYTAFMAALGGVLAFRNERRLLFLVAAGWIFGTLVVSYNFGALMIAVMMGGILIFGGRVLALWAATGAVALLFLLPALRQSGLLTFQTVLSLIERIDPSRATSLAFRLVNEDRLLAHALEKPFFGWGGWGRFRALQADEMSTVTDGFWIIKLGTQGWVGYLAFFGLLALPIIALPFLTKRREVGPATLALALIGAGNLLYLIPNSTLSPVSYMLFGAVAGLALRVRAPDAAQATTIDIPSRSSRVQYTRFSVGAAAEGIEATAPSSPTVPAQRFRRRE